MSSLFSSLFELVKKYVVRKENVGRQTNSAAPGSDSKEHVL